MNSGQEHPFSSQGKTPGKVHPKVLLVEDDSDILDLLEFTFSKAGWLVTAESNGNRAMEWLLEGTETQTSHQTSYGPDGALNALPEVSSGKAGSLPDLLVLDVMLPGLDGLSILRTLRKTHKLADLSVIMLTARGEELDRVLGLELGADDYMVKPFSPRELLLRAERLLGRQTKQNEAKQKLQHEQLAVDLEAYSATLDGVPVSLTHTEFRLLVDLMQHKGKVRSREQLLTSVWGYSFEGYARTVDTHMRRLRQKLGDAAIWLETLRGVGYRFKV